MGNVIASITGKAPATPAAPMLQPSIAGDLNEIKSIIGRHIASCSPLNSVTDRIIYKRTLQILVNESDASGNTALIGAAFSGHLDICKYLLEECGADLTVKNKIGCSALWIASGYGHVDVLNYLIQFVKKFDGKKNEPEKGKDGEVDGDDDGDGDDKKLELNLYQLLTEGNSSGDTPFLAAVSKGHDKIVKILFAASDAEDGSSSSSSSGDDGYDNDNDNSNGNSNNGNSNNSNSDSNAWKLLSTTNNGGDTPLAVAVGMGFDGPLLHTLLDAEEKLFKNGHDGDGDGNGNGNGNADERRTEDADGKKPIVMVSTNIDATSMFHEDARGANTAASNILTVLMAAKMFGETVTDQQLDQMENKVMFSFFQGENYGYMGSRSFFRDVAYPGFQCDSSTVTAIAKNKDDADAKMACLSPLRHDMDFENLGDIVNMISVDQVGILGTNSTFYVHDSNSGYYSDGALSGILTGLSSDDWNIVAASAGAIPPTPLSSLVNLSGGTVGGVVLAGYDAAFVDTSFYMSHSDSTKKVSIQMKSIAKAATIVARAALAAAYGEYYEAGSAMDAIEDLDKDDETFTTLASCLFSNGSCELLTNYATMENENMKAVSASESSYGVGASLGNPPNYYVSVFDWRNGQAFVQVDGVTYGSYNKEDKEYGASDKDEFFIRPNMLEASIHGLLNDFLGRGSVDSNGDTADLKSCSSTKDCSNVNYCQSSSDQAICSGSKVCVCSRSHYHVALDEAIIPSQNNFTGVFVVSDDDEGVSPMYTEPYWDSGIGVRVYRDSGDTATWTLALGASAAICSVVATYFMKSRLQKEKLY